MQHLGPGNGNSLTTVTDGRRRASWPIMGVAVLFVLVTFLTWHGTWFGRKLSDQELDQYLSDTRNARHVQQAIWQIGERIVQNDSSVHRLYPRLVELASDQTTEIRQVDAMVMGQDNTSAEFHSALSTLLNDPEPIVRRNAALALVRFGDTSGHDEIVSILAPYVLDLPEAGKIESLLPQGSSVKFRSMIAKLDEGESKSIEIRAPLPGTIAAAFVGQGQAVEKGGKLVSLNSDPDSVWESLRALYLIGQDSDLAAVDVYARGMAGMPERIKLQAINTAAAIHRKSQN